MSFKTTIAWTDHSWSPWEGCAHRSPGCKFCYAETQNHRWGKSNWGFAEDGRRQPLLERSEAHWLDPIRWNKKAAQSGIRPKVFPSVCDPFDEAAPHHLFVRFINLIDSTPALDWLLLTKCPQNILERLASIGREGLPANVWIGTSVENQTMADLRIPILAKIEARVRFLSLEPLLEAVDLGQWIGDWDCHACGNRFWKDNYADGLTFTSLTERGSDPSGEGEEHECPYCGELEGDTGTVGLANDFDERKQLDWLIIGGESGHGAREMKPAWVDSLITQGQAAGIPVFMKQSGTVLAREMGLKHKKGEDLTELPERWQIQEFPK